VQARKALKNLEMMDRSAVEADQCLLDIMRLTSEMTRKERLRKDMVQSVLVIASDGFRLGAQQLRYEGALSKFTWPDAARRAAEIHITVYSELIAELRARSRRHGTSDSSVAVAGSDGGGGNKRQRSIATLQVWMLKWLKRFQERGTFTSFSKQQDPFAKHPILTLKKLREAATLYLRTELERDRFDKKWQMVSAELFAKWIVETWVPANKGLLVALDSAQDLPDAGGDAAAVEATAPAAAAEVGGAAAAESAEKKKKKKKSLEERCSITPKTAAKWMAALGFTVDNRTPSGYVDGHERDDVKAARKLYVAHMRANDKRTVRTSAGLEALAAINDANVEGYNRTYTEEEQERMGVTLALRADGRQERPLIVMWHDESTFYTRDVIMRQLWVEAKKLKDAPASRGKSFKKDKDLGQSLMVSAFVSECEGVVDFVIHDREQTKRDAQSAAKSAAGRVTDPTDAAAMEHAFAVQEAAALTTGYWTHDLMKKQVQHLLHNSRAVKIKAVDVELHLDHSSNHMKKPADALDATRLNKTRGNFRQRGQKEATELRMRSGWWQGREFPMMENGQVIGLVETLRRRGYDEKLLAQWTKEKMVEVLSAHDDFKAAEEVTELTEFVAAQDPNKRLKVVFMPKFHCELNPIELVWGTMKKRLRRRKFKGSKATMTKEALAGSLRVLLSGKKEGGEKDSELDPISAQRVGLVAGHTRRFIEGYHLHPEDTAKTWASVVKPTSKPPRKAQGKASTCHPTTTTQGDLVASQSQ